MIEKHNSKLTKIEALRGFAALYVVLHHFNLSVLQFDDFSIIGLIIGQGQAAVMLFFVLSGFVIYYASHSALVNGKFNFPNYFLKRFRRIYPVFLGALLVSYIAASLAEDRWLPVDLVQLTGNLLNLQDHPRIDGIIIKSFFENGPLWSLSYEWWFYIFYFPIILYVPAKSQRYLVLSISLVGFFTYWMYPNKISVTLEYFIIWWTGVELARSIIINKAITRGTVIFIIGGIGLFICLSLVRVISFDGSIVLGKSPFIQLLHFLYTFIILITGLLWIKIRFWGFDHLFKPFVFFAPISYGIYVFHAPLTYRNILFSNNLFINFTVGLFVTLILSYLFEVSLQKKINYLTNRFLIRK